MNIPKCDLCKNTIDITNNHKNSLNLLLCNNCDNNLKKLTASDQQRLKKIVDKTIKLNVLK